MSCQGHLESIGGPEHFNRLCKSIRVRLCCDSAPEGDAVISLEANTERRIAGILSGMLIALLMVVGVACGDASDDEDLKPAVVEALDALAKELVSDRPVDADAYADRLGVYLEAHPAFFGSGIALLDASGEVMSTPYVYRTGDDYSVTDLHVPSYRVEDQDWFTGPMEADAAVWTEPYFDAGGGDIWMITRSVPLRDAERVFAIVTTDLAVDDPNE